MCQTISTDRAKNCDGTTGTTTGVGPGEAIINGVWTGDAWLSSPTGVCDYTPVEVLREAICDILSRRVDSVSPERALIGQPVDVVINGSGFGTGLPTVEAGNGITVSNVQLINSSEVRARFTIESTAPPGNHAVSVTTSSGLTTTTSGNFYVQTPYAFSAISVTQTNLNCSAGTAGYGVQVMYQVVDNQGHPIAQSGMTPEEIVSSAAGGFSYYRSFATPPTTDGCGKFLDTPVGTCSNANFNFCIDVLQEFRIRIPGNDLYGDEAVAALTNHLNAESDRERALAVVLVGHLGGSRVVAPLKNVVETDRSPDLRISALRWLSQAPSDLALPIIRKAARTDVDENVRRAARAILDPSIIEEVPGSSAPFKAVPQ